MSDYGSKHFRISNLNFASNGFATDLEGAVKLLPARVKQAFYGAAVRKGTIKRSTWDGCAFNAGGEEIGLEGGLGGIASVAQAAEAFGTSHYLVSNFIKFWDASKTRWETDEEATTALIGILEEIGIFTEPDKPQVRVVNIKVYEGNMTDAELLHEFKEDLNNESFDEEFKELVSAAELCLA